MRAKRYAPLILFFLSACGTYQLGTVQSRNKSPDQQQLDILTCKEEARLAANTAERQVGAFILGMTIVGTPVAYELEKSKTREVYGACMTAKGYAYTSPDEVGKTASTVVRPTSTLTATPVQGKRHVLPDGTSFEQMIQGPLVYPEEALRKRVSGTVNIRFAITADGYPTNVHSVSRQVANQSVDTVTLLDLPAIEYIKQSRWLVQNLRSPSQIIEVVQPVTFSPSGVTGGVSEVQTVAPPVVTAVPAPARPASAEPPASPSGVQTPNAIAVPKDEIAQLEKLKALRDRGLITEEDFNKKKLEILNKL